MSCRACTTWWRRRGAGARAARVRRFADLARGLHTLVAEVTELTERVDNALQVTEDVYLARIYAAALELFRVPSGERGGGAQARDHPRHLFGAVRRDSASRTELMEFLIVVLIMAEIIIALVRP